MLETIPSELGTIIPDDLVLCSECREVNVKTCPDDPEPLCWGCRTRDDLLGRFIGGGTAHPDYRGRRELVVPVEHANYGPKRFGTGSGEIESCELVQAMRRDKEDDRDASLCRWLLWGFLTLEGLIVLAAAALR